MTKLREGVVTMHFLILTLVLASCTHVYKPSMEPIADYAEVKKFDLDVALHLTENFRNAKWEMHMRGDTLIFSLGEGFSKNAEMVTRRLFSRVVVNNNGTAPGDSGIHAILTPRMVFVDQTKGPTAFHEVVLTATLEWALKDVNGDIIWIDTIRGEGKANMGNIFTHHGNAEERIKELNEDLFHKSFHAIASSAEIQEFAANH